MWSQVACQLEGYVNDVVRQLKPQAVGEEYSEAELCDALASDDRAYLVIQRVCILQGVEHMFCDPDQSERDALYKAHCTTEAEDKGNGWPIREDEWLRRLGPRVSKGTVLFVCGANHVPTFSQRLNAVGVGTSVVCEDFDRQVMATAR